MSNEAITTNVPTSIAAVPLPIAETLEHIPSMHQQQQPDEEDEHVHQQNDATSQTTRIKSTRMQLRQKGNRESGLISASQMMHRNPPHVLQERKEGDQESRTLEDLGASCGVQIEGSIAVCVPNTSGKFGLNTLHTKADGSIGLRRGQDEPPIFAAWSLAESGESGALVLHDGPIEDGIILGIFRRNYKCCSGWGVGTLTSPKGTLIGTISSSTWVTRFDICDKKGTRLFRCTNGKVLLFTESHQDNTIGFYKTPSLCCGGGYAINFPTDLTISQKLLFVTLLCILRGSDD